LGTIVTTELNAAIGMKADVLRGQSQVFCYEARRDYNIIALFEQVSIILKSDEDFNWHAVRGISSDDFHSVMEKFVLGLFTTTEGNVRTDELVFEKVSLARDLLSSCPSPFGSFSGGNNKCVMTFSPYGRACVSVKVDRSVQLEIDTIVGFNFKMFLNLICGIGLFIGSHFLSKSKVFQYSGGSLIFIIGGLLVMLYFIMNRFVNKKTTGMTLTTLFISGSYGWGLLHLLKHHLTYLLLKQWEVVMGYVVIMGGLGLLCVKLIRSNDNAKHTTRVGAKWMLRIIGIIFIYNSSASPSGSMAMIGAFIAIYAVQHFLTPKFSSKNNKKTE
jgi:hypothetical protein